MKMPRVVEVLVGMSVIMLVVMMVMMVMMGVHASSALEKPRVKTVLSALPEVE